MGQWFSKPPWQKVLWKTNSSEGYGIYCHRKDTTADQLRDNVMEFIAVLNGSIKWPDKYSTKPLLLTCITTARTLSDVKDSCPESVMDIIQDERKLGIIILHPAAKHALPDTNETMQYTEHKELTAFNGNVFELYYNNKNKIYNVPSNNEVLKRIHKFLGVLEAETNELNAMNPNKKKKEALNNDTCLRNIGTVPEKSLKDEIMDFKPEKTKTWNIAIFEHTETGQQYFVNSIDRICHGVNPSTDTYDKPLIVRNIELYNNGDILQEIGLEEFNCIIKGTPKKGNKDNQTDDGTDTKTSSSPTHDDRMHSVGFVFSADVKWKSDIVQKVYEYIKSETMKNMPCSIILTIDDQLEDTRSLYKNTEVYINKVEEWAKALSVAKSDIVPIKNDTNEIDLNGCVYVLWRCVSCFEQNI